LLWQGRARHDPFLVAEIAHIDTLIVPSEKEALLVENTLIKKHKPNTTPF